jgi:hypothetical protein
MVVCLLGTLCVVRYRSLHRTDHSCRGVLPRVGVFVNECGQGPQQFLLQCVGRQRSKLRKEENTIQRGNFIISIYR